MPQRRRRIVRVAPSFFDRLDQLLPAERANAAPSTADFLRHELAPIIDRLAQDYEGETLPVPDVPEVRVMIATSFLVDRIAIYAGLTIDDAFEIIHLDIERRPS